MPRHNKQRYVAQESVASEDYSVQESAPRRQQRPHEDYSNESPRYVQQNSINGTLVVVIVALLVVAIFGGALVGGVVSGDPSNGFFVTIIVASSVAICIAVVVSISYYCGEKTRRGNRAPTKRGRPGVELRRTFTGSHDDEEGGAYDEEEGRNYEEHRAPAHPARTPVERHIREVQANSRFPGDVSAMSPTTFYDNESYAQSETQYTQSEYDGNGYSLRIKPQYSDRSRLEHERSSFDFASVASTRTSPVREDPPEDPPEGDEGTYNSKAPYPGTMDPSAAIATADGKLVPLEEDYDDATAYSEETGRSSKRKRGRSKSPGRKSVLTKDALPKSPARGAASESGSVVSSLFLKPFSTMFGKKRSGSSEAGGSESNSYVKGSRTGHGGLPSTKNAQTPKSTASGFEGKPPMPGRRTPSNNSRKGLDTIGGTSAPPTPGNNSVYSIPPPRRVPSTPGSEAPSEFRSVAEDSAMSGVASSTFDPAAHDRAVARTRKNAAPLGAVINDMATYYEDEESTATSAVQSEPAARSVQYDVFAPSGPIGIVVDTVEKGCIVHSLKKSSPMLGMMNPGDLIVALDDFDVRKMDAASLTKLMAKKSTQKSRKFTLLPSDES